VSLRTDAALGVARVGTSGWEEVVMVQHCRVRGEIDVEAASARNAALLAEGHDEP
jgi:hypothetical protein